MAIFDTLSTEDKAKMYDYIYLYGSRSNHTQPTAKLETILRFWDEAKSEYLFDMMGGELIKSKKITFEKDESEIAETIRNEITRTWGSRTPYYEFLAAWEELYINLTNEMDDHAISWAMQDLIGGNTLASNRYNGNTVEIPLPGNKKYRLAAGAKASKAIGKIAMAYNLPKYEDFRIAHSQVLNEKSVSGELCLSIHPLDFMTMSDNDCGWSSCMSWADHGDFRQGTVEMMNSPMVVMAYLKSSTDYVLNSADKVYWNSKRWRQLFIVTPEVICAIKGYPYWNEGLEKEAMIWIKELVETSDLDGFGPYDDKLYEYSGHNNYITYGEDTRIPLEFGTKLMYNDLYDRHRIFICEDAYRLPDYIMYSGESECMCCGGVLYDWESESDLFCPDCDPVYRCSECGDWHTLDELIEVDGDYYCSYCYDDHIVECASCGTPHDYRNMTCVHLASDRDHVSIEKEIYIDDNCLFDNELFDEDEMEYARQRWGGRVNFIRPEQLTDKGVEAFGFNSREEALSYTFEEDTVYDFDSVW